MNISKKAIIVGGTSGIGLVISKHLAHEGYHEGNSVIISGRFLGKLDALKKSIE